MRKTRIYLNRPLIINNIIEVCEQPFQHLVKVLRLKENQQFIAFNGDNYDYLLSIQKIKKRSILCYIDEKEFINSSSPLNITLYQAISKSKSMDWTIQKSTELGVSKIIPFYSERSQNRLKEKQRQAHWKKVILSACEQCGRADIVELDNIISFEQVIKSNTAIKNSFVLHFSSDAIQFKDIKNEKMKKLSIICGSEGGFTDKEAIKLKATNSHILDLGPRVLRTETASIASIAIFQSLFGDI